MSEVVLSDAQMSMLNVLRPMSNFEEVYQGQPGTIPIAFPGTLDPDAGKDGFSPNLLQGIPVPFGARICVYIPMTIDQYTSQSDYGYQFLWRMRSRGSFESAMQAGRLAAPYHLSTEEPGRKETILTPAPYLFIPASSDVEIFEQSEPVTNVPAQLNVRQQIYVPRLGDSWVQPLTPDGNDAEWQQGAYQFTSNVNCSGPTWFPLWFDAGGDEMLILCYKRNTVNAWDFASTDKAFSNTYGTNDGGLPLNPNIGIMYSTGTQGS